MTTRDTIISQRLSRELTSSRDRKRRRDQAAELASRVQALRLAVPPESAWRVGEVEAIEPTLSTGGLHWHVRPVEDLAALAGLPAEVSGACDQVRTLAGDVLTKLAAIQADRELNAAERLDLLLEESQRLLDRAERLASKLKETLPELETKRADTLAKLTAGPADALHTWIVGMFSSKSPGERSAMAVEAAVHADTPTVAALLRAPKFANVAGGRDLNELAEQWFQAAHGEDHRRLDVVRRVHEGATKAASTIGEHVGQVLDRAVVAAVEQGLVSTSPAPAAA